MRLFVAVDPPPAACDHLRAAAAGLEGVRLTRPESWHVTLAFCGEVGASTATRVRTALGEVAADQSPVDLRLAGSGHFGGALWVGVHGDLGPLAAAVIAAVRACGLGVEDRPFRPHLTIARSASSRPPMRQQRALSSYEGPTWTCRELRLVRSHLERPVRHETVAAWPLGAG